jgi:hypothetical protein
MPPWTAESPVESLCAKFRPQLRIPRLQRVSQSRSIRGLHKKLGLTALPMARGFFFTFTEKPAEKNCVFAAQPTSELSPLNLCQKFDG